MNLGTIWASVGLDTRQLDAGLASSQTKLAAADRKMMTMGQRLTANSTRFMMAGGVMVAAAGAAGAAVTKMASDFETGMRNANSIMRLSEDEFSNVSAAVLDISKQLPQSASVLAEGLYDIASSGFQGADGLTVLEASARAAAAGLTDTATSAKGITAVLNAYGLEAEEADRISDTMFRTVDKGVITFEQLSGSIGTVLGSANLANIEFEELSGALGYITTQGLGADEATTALNRTILSIIDPSEELAEVLRRAGYESGEMALQQIGLVGVLGLVDEAAGGSITKLQEMFKDMRSLRGAGALLSQGIGELSGYMEDFSDTTGATNLALEEQSKTLSFQMDLLKSSLSATAIELGSRYIPAITDTTKRTTAFIDRNADLIVTLGDIGIKSTLAVGGILLMVGALGKLRAAALAHPIGLVAAAIAALNVGVGVGINKLEDFETWWSKTLIALGTGLAPISQSGKLWSAAAYAIDEYKEGNISLWDTLTMRRSDAQAQVEIQNDLAAGIFDSVEAYEQALIMARRYGDDLPNATSAVMDLVNQLHAGEISVEAFEIGILKLREATRGGRQDVEDYIIAEDGANSTREGALELMEMQAAGYSLAEDGINRYTGAVNENVISLNEQMSAINETRSAFSNLMSAVFDLRDAEVGLELAKIALAEAQEAVNKHTDEGSVGTKEYWQDMQKLNRAQEDYQTQLHNIFTAQDADIQQKEEARLKALEWGFAQLEAGEMGELALSELLKMFEITGVSADLITHGIEQNFMAVAHQINEATKEANNLKSSIDNLPNKKAIEITINRKYTGSPIGPYLDTGGIITATGVKRYDTGGIISAAGGTVVPQTGREVPIIAHEGEMILNTSQQNNLIDALWGVANGKGSASGGDINLNFSEPVIIREEADIDRIAQALAREIKFNSAGVGIR